MLTNPTPLACFQFSGVTRVKGGLLRINVADMASISQYELRVSHIRLCGVDQSCLFGSRMCYFISFHNSCLTLGPCPDVFGQNAVAKHGDLKFFEADKDGAVARFGGEGEADIAKKALESAETKFGEQVPTYTVMEGTTGVGCKPVARVANASHTPLLRVGERCAHRRGCRRVLEQGR